MRAVFGILLIFGGLLLGYAVLAGKFPPASSTSSSSSSSSSGAESLLTVPDTSTSSSSTIVGSIQTTPNNPLGLPTVTALSDKAASTGGMK